MYSGTHEAASRRFLAGRILVRVSLLRLTLRSSSCSFLHHLHYGDFFQGPVGKRIQERAEMADRFSFPSVYLRILIDLCLDGRFSFLSGPVTGSISVLDHEGGRGFDHHPGNSFHRPDHHSFPPDGEAV